MPSLHIPLFVRLGSRRVTEYYPDLKIQEITTNGFWERQRRLFVKERNVTVDRYEDFTRKQGTTETLQQYKICKKWTKRGPYALLCKSSDVNVQDEQKFELSLQDTDVAAYVN